MQFNSCATASETWTFAHLLPLLIGDLIHNKVLENFKNITKTLIVTSGMYYVLGNPTFSVDTVEKGPGKCNFVDML